MIRLKHTRFVRKIESAIIYVAELFKAVRRPLIFNVSALASAALYQSLHEHFDSQGSIGLRPTPLEQID